MNEWCRVLILTFYDNEYISEKYSSTNIHELHKWIFMNKYYYKYSKMT